MQKFLWFALSAGLLFVAPMYCGAEFIKKPKPKKETSSQVKEEIAELLESAVRQLGQNIKQSVDVQNKMFDAIKEILSDNQLSTQQLKELRNRLEQHLKKLEEQQADLYDVLLSCKLICA